LCSEIIQILNPWWSRT